VCPAAAGGQFLRCDWHHCQRCKTTPRGHARLFRQSCRQAGGALRCMAAIQSGVISLSSRASERHQGRRDNEITRRPSHSTVRPSARPQPGSYGVSR